MNVYKIINLDAHKNAQRVMQPCNQPKYENTLSRLIE